MCDIVAENYVCVDPMDSHIRKFKDKEKLCSDVMDDIWTRF